MSTGPATARAARHRGWFLGMLFAGALYLGFHLTRGWFPHDEGALGQMAERVLAGEVPHRDFDEPYTGLLTYLHAAAFAVGGIRLSVLRMPLYLAAMLWLGALYAIARRSVGPAAAAAVALLALIWSVPNYPASMPSWYNLFCATFGVLALLRWGESGRAWWLFAAGVAGGISFLFKLSGLFYVAGALLYLVFATREPPADAEPSTWGGALASAAITGALLLFVLLLWRSIAPYYEARPIIHFVIPGAAIACALTAREWRAPVPSASIRLRRLLGAGIPFLGGAALPVLIFAAGYAAAGGLDDLVHGVFVAPFRRLVFANMRPPAPFWVLAAVPLAILLRPRPDAGNHKWRRMGLLVSVLLAIVLWLAATDNFPHRVVWQSIRSLLPILALCGAAVIAWPRLTLHWTPGARERFVLLAIVSALASLVQFPFSAPIYFLYVAPLCLLTLVALLTAIGSTPAPLTAVTLGFYAVFAVLLVTPGAVVGLGFRYERAHRTVDLALPRAGLRVLPADADLYEALIPRLRDRAGNGDIWAGPDAPEVYFLGGFRNRTRAIFDFLGPEDQGHTELLREIERPEVTAVVLNGTPSFSRPLSPPLRELLRERFPHAETIGRFELRWRR